MSESDPNIVHVSTASVEALSEPTFIIEVDGKYYVTLAVWEYDPRAPHLDERQQRDIAELAEIYEGLVRSSRGHTSVLARFTSLQHFVQSGPPR